MLGALIGSYFTNDDIGDCILTLPVDNLLIPKPNKNLLEKEIISSIREFIKKHPDYNYSQDLIGWSKTNKQTVPFFNSVIVLGASCGAVGKNIEEVKALTKKIIMPLSNDSNIYKEAEALAVSVYMAYNNALKSEIFDFIKKTYYDPYAIEADANKNHNTNSTILPQAISIFLESVSFEDALNKVNLYETETGKNLLAALTCCIAEAYYGAPKYFEKRIFSLEKEICQIYNRREKTLKHIHKNNKFSILTKYISKLSSQDNIFNFINEFFVFSNTYKEYDLENYNDILKSKNLQWNEDTLLTADCSNFDEHTVLACIMGVLRAEYFSSGVLELFNEKGLLDQWLKKLEDIHNSLEPETEAEEIAEINFELNHNNSKESICLNYTKLNINISEPETCSSNFTYNFNQNISQDLVFDIFEKIQKALISTSWLDTKEVDETSCFYKLSIIRENKSKEEHFGIYNRVHLPEKEWLDVIKSLKIFFPAFSETLIINISQFMNAMKKGEVKYCGVEFHEGGRLYHYRTKDLSIMEGDEVVVPVGSENDETTAYVKKIQFYKWDNTPYPLEKTKCIIRKYQE